MILWLLIVALVLWIALFKFKRRKLYVLASKIPQPKASLPIIGVAHKFTGNMEDMLNTLKELCYEALNTSELCGVWACHLFFTFSLNPVDLEMIFRTCIEKDDLYRFLQWITGNGILFAPVSFWRPRRKIALPVFNQKIVDGFVEVFAEQSQILTQRLVNMPPSETFDIGPLIKTYTMDSVCETVLGVKNHLTPQVVATLKRVLHITIDRISHIWWHPDWMFKLFYPHYAEYKQTLQHLNDLTDQVISKKRTELMSKQQGQPKTNSYELESCQRQSFLGLLINSCGSKNKYSDLELREETISIIVAGGDTSSSAIGFTLLLLGKYPEIQEKVYNELYEVFGDSERSLVKEDLSQLKYLERVIKESMRLFPPVPFIGRKVGADDVTLPSGATLPAGSGIIISSFAMHHNPKYWGPDVEHYDPDRFLPERFKLEHPCSYIPFSNGPRNCIGHQYAMMLMKTLLSTMLRSYKIVCEPEKGPIPYIRAEMDIMLRPVEGYQIALERRKPCTTMTS